MVKKNQPPLKKKILLIPKKPKQTKQPLKKIIINKNVNNNFSYILRKLLD